MYEVEVFVEKLKNNYSVIDIEYSAIEKIESLLEKEKDYAILGQATIRPTIKTGICKCGHLVSNVDKRCDRCNQKLRWL